MFKTKFVAILLCLTTVFTLFAGGAYAENGVTYIDETTLVIEDGKVVSGDKSLIDNGIVVIGDSSSVEEEEDSVTEKDSFASEAPYVNNEETKGEESPNGTYGSPLLTPETKPETGKIPAKDNSALLTPDSKTDISDKNDYDIILPSEIPTAVNPNVPTESVKRNSFLNYSNMVYLTTDSSLSSSYRLTERNIYVLKSQTVNLNSFTITSYTYRVYEDTAVFYRGKNTSSSATFIDAMFDIEANKTFYLKGDSSLGKENVLYLDGRFVSFPGSLTGDLLNSNDISSTSYVSTGNAQGPLIYVRSSGTMDVDSCTLRYNNNKTSSNNAYSRNGGAACVMGNFVTNDTAIKNCSAIYGGAIYVNNGGICTLSNTNIESCEASYGGAVEVKQGGTFTMTGGSIKNCKATNNGGAIYAESGSTITLNNVTIQGCSATNGGAIFLAGNATLSFKDVTIKSNTATNGGGMYINNGFSATVSDTNDLVIGGSDANKNTATYGGGIYVKSGTVNLNNVQVTHNTASVVNGSGGGMYIAGGNVTVNGTSKINNNTAHNNGGAICVASGSLTVSGSSEISNNSLLGTVIPTSTNIASQGTYKGTGTVYTSYTSDTGDWGSYHAGKLVDKKVGLDAATCVMLQAATPSTSIYIIFKFTGNIHVDRIRLYMFNGVNITNSKYASVCYPTKITAYISSSEDYTNLTGATKLGESTGDSSTEVRVNEANSIYGFNRKEYNLTSTSEKEGSYLIFKFDKSGYYLFCSEIEINGYLSSEASTEPSYGGGMYISGGTVNMNGGTIKDHSDIDYGGGVYVAGGNANFNGGTISNNTARTDGGGICCYGGNVSISGATITGNGALHGGGVYVTKGATAEMSSGTISNNTDGGGVFMYNGCNFTLSGGEIKGNAQNSHSDNYHGGGVIIWNNNGGTFKMTGGAISDHSGTKGHGVGQTGNGGTILIEGGTISGNTVSGVSGYGGGVYITAGTLTMTGGTITGNKTGTNGGGVYILDATFNMSGTAEITGNEATGENGQGGGVYATGACVINITGNSGDISKCAISDNVSFYQGGGFYIIGVTTADNIKINNVTIDGNIAEGDRGGGMYVNFSNATNMTNKMRINNVTFSNNVSQNNGGNAVGHGGAIYAANCTMFITGSRFNSNSATYRGGGLYCTANTVVEVRDSSFVGNSTDNYGGGMHAYDNSQTTLINCSFDNNTAKHGGALFTAASSSYVTSLDLIDTTIGTTTLNEATGYGGGIGTQGSCNIRIVRGNISNNKATYGGGIYAEGATTTVAISDNTNILTSVPSDVAATGTGTVISGNMATTGNGGGVCIVNAGNCSIANAEIYGNIAPNDTPDESNGTSYITTGTTGNGGGIYVRGTSLTISGCTVGKSGQPNSAVYGGGIAVFKGATVEATNVNVSYNIAVKSGGGYCVLGSGVSASDLAAPTTITISGGSVTYNEAQSTISDTDYPYEMGGGGMYIRGLSDYKDKGVEATIDNVAINNNKSVRGGAIYLHEQADLIIKNCNSIKANEATQLGGALFMIKGKATADISNCAFTENIAGLRGGALYIQVDGCKVANTTMIGNKANGLSWGAGKGGAIYVTTPSENNTTVNLPLTNVDFTDNESQYGGAICVADGAYPINITLSASGSNACDFEGNTATISGGAILVSGTNAEVTMTEGHITNNKAGETASTVSPYQQAYTASSGVGGGVAVFNGGAFSLTGNNIAIYGNTASTAGDDVFANGKNTQLIIPAPNAMNTVGFGKEGAVWWEDYMTDDANYEDGLNGDSRVIERYDSTPISIRAYTALGEGVSPSGRYINDAGRYVAITFDVQKYNMGSIKITAPAATDTNQRFVFTVNGTTTLGDEIYFSISLPSGESVTVSKLLPGTYTVTMESGWSWRYTLNGATLDGSATDVGAGSVEIKITGTEVDEVHSVVYSADKENNKWLSHNSDVEKNVATESVAYHFDPAVDEKRLYV